MFPGTSCDGTVVRFLAEEERIVDARELILNVRATFASPVYKNLMPILWKCLNGLQVNSVDDIAKLVLRIYGAYARRYYGIPSQDALHNPDGVFLLGSLRASILRHSDHRWVYSR